MADCSSCICNDCNENRNNNMSYVGCCNCDVCEDKTLQECPIGRYRNDYGDGEE